MQCTLQDYTAHCRQVFDLPAMGPPPICTNPSPTHLPFSTADLASALLVFKGNKASGPSPVPSQLVKHLAPACVPILSRMFFLVAKAGILAKWNEVRVTPVFKKGDSRLASNYRPVSVMGPIAKLYSTCMNMALTRQAADKGWRATTQAGFRPTYHLEDLVFPVDMLLADALQKGKGLALCFVDLEKAFDTVPRARLISTLLHHYNIHPTLVEQVRRMYVNTCGTVAGDTVTFNTTSGVR